MKIAIFSDNFYPELSGITDSILILAKNLDEKGYKIDIYAPKYAEKNYRILNISPAELQIGNNIKIIRIPSLPYPAPTMQGRVVIPSLWRWRKMKKENYDLIHTHLFFGTGIEAWQAAKHLRIPLVGTSHTPISEFIRYSPVRSHWIESSALRYVSWFYNKCDLVTAPSNGIIQEMREYGFDKPAQVVSNPIDLQNYKPVARSEKIALKKKYNLPSFVALCSGRLAPEKNIDVIIRAVEKIRQEARDVCLVITGHGSARKDLEKMVRANRMEGNVRFFGTVKEQELIQLYQASDVFVIASTAETQSIALMKAFACALPVIGVDSRALPEYINESNGYIVPPGDIDSIAGKLLDLFRDSNLRELKGRAGVAEVKTYSQENISKIWDELYNYITCRNIK